MNDRDPISTNDIDQLLTDFFRAAQPNPWPRIAPPESTPRAAMPIIPMRKRSSSPGRFALAASVSFLAFSGLWLTSLAPIPSNGPGVDLDAGTAERTSLRRAAPIMNEAAKALDEPSPNPIRQQPKNLKNKN